MIFASFAGANEAEETVAFVGDPSGEEEMVLLARGSSCGEAQAPQTIDSERKIQGVVQLADKATAGKIKNINAAVAEVPHQKMMAGAAESAGSDSESPRRIQHALRREARKPGAVGAEYVDEAMAQAAREGKGAVSLDGRLIDIASIRMAEALLAKAEAMSSTDVR